LKITKKINLKKNQLDNEKLYHGYDPEFLINDEIKEIVHLPIGKSMLMILRP
jgi:hypothetical protein